MSVNVNALLFDVFGTVVDWHSGVVREGEALSETHDLDVDWAEFARAWREQYAPSLQRVREGEIPWRNLDALHRESLEELLVEFDLEDLPADDRATLNHVWHRLDPWPDAIPGLLRLRREYFVGTLSNGHVRLLANMAKRAGFPWDAVLSAELSGHYKPDAEVYETGVDLLDEDPGDVCMVACHEVDLDAARDAGLRTAYVRRPREWGADVADGAPTVEDDAYDVVADDIVDLAERLDA